MPTFAPFRPHVPTAFRPAWYMARIGEDYRPPPRHERIKLAMRRAAGSPPSGGCRVLGATIVGRHAGELTLPWVLAVEKGMKIGAVAGVIAPCPTLGAASKRAAGSYFTPKLFSAGTSRLIGFLQRLDF